VVRRRQEDDVAESRSKWERAIAEGHCWDQRLARAALTAWRRSGLSMSAFARQRGLSPQRLAWWRTRLGSAEQVSLAPLVPVTVTAASAAVEIVVGDVRVDVAAPEAVSPTWVAELVDRLRRRGS
jgi:hypothetical protein